MTQREKSSKRVKLADHVLASLKFTGLQPAVFSDTLLNHGPSAVEMREYLRTGNVDQIVHNGGGWYLNELRPKSHYVSHLFMKGLHLVGYKVRFMGLTKLVRVLRDKEAETLDEVRVLGIGSFYTRDFPQCPLDPKDIFLVRNFLLDEWMPGGNGVVLCADGSLRKASEWWGESFTQILEDKLMPITIDLK